MTSENVNEIKSSQQIKMVRSTETIIFRVTRVRYHVRSAYKGIRTQEANSKEEELPYKSQLEWVSFLRFVSSSRSPASVLRMRRRKRAAMM